MWIIILYVLFSTAFVAGIALEGESNPRETLRKNIWKWITTGWFIFPFSMGVFIAEVHNYIERRGK